MAEAGYDLALPTRRLSASQALALGERVEAAGWRGVWLSEVLALDALVTLGMLAARTTRLRLGTCIVPISTRSPAVLAMAAATLAQLAPGRIHLGLGLSTPGLVAQRHGRPVRRPLAEARGVVEVVRAALRGETVERAADPAVHDLRIEAPPTPPPVLLAALGPRMLDLALEVADGLALSLLDGATAQQRAAHAHVARGPAYEVVLLQRTCVDPTPADREALRREVASYARVPAYAADFARRGVDVVAVVAAPDLATATALLPDALLDDLVILGSAAECHERLQALVAGGVTPLIVPPTDPAALARTIDGLSPR